MSATRFTGRIEHERIPDVLAADDVAVAPLHAGYPWGSPMKLFEYLAAGKATVASANGQIPHVVDDGQTGLLYPAGDSQALAERLAALVREPALRESIGAAARERALREHTWEAVTKRVTDIAEGLLA